MVLGFPKMDIKGEPCLGIRAGEKQKGGQWAQIIHPFIEWLEKNPVNQTRARAVSALKS